MEKTIKAIIVDDEESAREVLSFLLKRHCPTIEIVAYCEDVPQAVQAIQKNKPNVVFLDIEMPNYNGFELMSFFKNIDFDIIFITAYERYAIRAFQVAAIDYLLKPIEIDRLKEAVDKLQNKLHADQIQKQYQVLVEGLQKKEVKNIVIATQRERYVLAITDIIAIKAQEAYCSVYTIAGKEYMVSKHLKHYESLLEGVKRFFRTHKSWIVNLDHIVSYSKTSLEIRLSREVVARLSKYKKAAFLEEFKIEK